MEYYDRMKRITVVDTLLKHSLTLDFGPGPEKVGGAGNPASRGGATSSSPNYGIDGDYLEWKEALISNLRLYTALVQNAEAAIDTVVGISNQIKNGLLRMRPPKGGEVWPEHHFFINEHAMIVVDRYGTHPFRLGQALSILLFNSFIISSQRNLLMSSQHTLLTAFMIPSHLTLSNHHAHHLHPLNPPPLDILSLFTTQPSHPTLSTHPLTPPSHPIKLIITSEPEDKTNARIIGEYVISPNCSVFETNLGVYTFELVTAKKVLHVQAPNTAELIEWIDAVREAIVRSYLDTTDPLFQQVIKGVDGCLFGHLRTYLLIHRSLPLTHPPTH